MAVLVLTKDQITELQYDIDKAEQKEIVRMVCCLIVEKDQPVRLWVGAKDENEKDMR